MCVCVFQCESRGELLASLSYQPVSHRLSVVVLKARHLPKMDITGLSASECSCSRSKGLWEKMLLKVKHQLSCLARLVEQRPSTEAVSSLQRLRVRVPACSPLLRVPPPHPVSCRIISCSINQAIKAKNIYIKKKSGTLKLETFCGGVLTVLT